MTYQELYRAATTWQARHIAQDYYLMYGASEIASQEDISKVSRFQVEEGGEPIAPLPNKLTLNGFDYSNQAWVIGGKYVRCGHPEHMSRGCYGRTHEGEPCQEIEQA